MGKPIQDKVGNKTYLDKKLNNIFIEYLGTKCLYLHIISLILLSVLLSSM